MVQERPDYSVIGNVAVSALPRTATAALVSIVSVTDGGQTLAVAAAGRVLVMLQVDGPDPVYVRFGPGAQVNAYHVILAGGVAGVGGGLVIDCYTGIITAICAAAGTSDVAVTEFLV